MKNCYYVDTKEKEKYIFSLIEQLYKDGLKITIFSQNKDRAEELDKILWTMKQESFIPHKIFKYDEPDALESVAIVCQEINPINASVLIMDSPCSISYALNYDTIYDFVDKSSDESLQKSRERYAKFKEKKCNMHYIK
ncbi:MAG: DNA polymerase III subunit chi [Proteobacteria bacterium]|nr:DNA polymerase III subunit chi [Pseudomonadota bacterium]